MEDFNLAGKLTLVRLDINSPVDPHSGTILNDNRIRQHMATLRELREARVGILSHQGRPGKDDFIPMESHAERIAYYLGREVRYVDSLFGKSAVESLKALRPGDYLMLENTRFYSEEVVLKNAPPAEMAASHMVTTLAPLADLFINDAFAAAHRAQPSLVGFCEVLPSLAGRVLEREVTMLETAIKSKARPKLAILGGVKADDSVEVARYMLEQGTVDRVLTTGAVANLFLWASGVKIGKASEAFLQKEVPKIDGVLAEATEILKRHRDSVAMPEDLVLNVKGEGKSVPLGKLPSEYPIQDIGVNTLVRYLDEVSRAKVIILNGPAGVFEVQEFSEGTRELFLGVARSNAFKVVGGGHTVTVMEQLGVTQQIDHTSTGGGSLISYLAGKKLPVIEALKASKAKYRDATSNS